MLTKIKNVLPGDDVPSNGSKSLGIHGTKATIVGTLCKTSNHLFVVSKTNRYHPCIDDIVIGKAILTSQDMHRIDLGGVVGALPSLSFTNATKRNKPEINKGDYLLCKIARTGTEPLLTCVGEGFGKLSGVVLPLEPWKVRLLYLSTTLATIGKKYRFRIALGLNGFVWIDAEKDTDIRDIYHLLSEDSKLEFPNP
ncbi:S1-like RNA-binding domain-containing protein [Encephalitozoon intestinalis ATCC 50506]|uniref:S1-like RNA-binding domain-containing protein n=1 Tax=Encephalitozoon intestinalis (strain ATCC 50506) TaxID=876142 RepID=E0S911_ENCIT|nr:S1-like RNA-binding domain-containing protein [Encephalitozoon intestinalis ATCC 50506]ADM12276.1 S1-like RNA-binding domain-containing protein [Encephalitozoon intestinalis ATCC 50506]UTX46084.1 putative exosome complex component Rrp40 [Encephalitozoon intestinalis]